MKFSLFNPWPVYDVPLNGEWPAAPRLSLPESTLSGVQKGIAISRLADQVGFDYITIAEHHYHPRQMTPNPFLIGAAVSQHLDRAGVAVLGATLPLVNPIRTAEEVCMLDALTGGKLLVGLFRGTPNEYLTYGTNPAETRPVFEEAVDLIREAWTQPEPFAWVGRYYDFRVVSVWPRPVQHPHPPILVSANSPASGTHAARNHFRIGIGFFPAGPVAKMVAHYLAEAERFGWTPSPEHVLHRGFCVVADTDQQAEDLVQRTRYGDMSALMARNDNGVMAALGKAMAGSVPDGAAPSAPSRAPSAGRPHFVGSPDTVARQIREFADLTGVGHFDLIFNDIQMPFEDAYSAALLFGKEVIPQFAEAGAAR